MPLYEYRCDACGHTFELIVKFSDPPVEICPVCGGHVHKLMSSPAFQFKGTGWYVTDYAKKNNVDAGKTGEGTSDSSGTDKGGAAGKAEGGAKSESSEKGAAPGGTSASSPAAPGESSPAKSGSDTAGKSSTTKSTNTGSA